MQLLTDALRQGNETRMGKGKGTFEFWATRVGIGRVVFEIGGVPIREELARDGASPPISTTLLLVTDTVSRVVSAFVY